MKTKILAKTPFGVSLFEAMVDLAGKEDLLDKFNINPDGDNTEVDFSVIVAVNGVVVPFEENFEELVKRVFDGELKRKRKDAENLKKQYRNDVLLRARQLVYESRFQRLTTIIEQSAGVIEQELEELLKDEVK